MLGVSKCKLGVPQGRGLALGVLVPPLSLLFTKHIRQLLSESHFILNHCALRNPEPLCNDFQDAFAVES